MLGWRLKRPERARARGRRDYTDRDPAIRVGALAALVDAAAEIGIAPGAVLAGTDLDPRRLRNSLARVSWQQLSTALENI